MSETKKKGLGDYIEDGINTVMPKTAERVKKSGGCGCNKRKKAFNDLGELLTGK